MADVFNAIDPRIFHRLDTNMWRVAATYLPAAEIAKLATCCRYFNHEIVWHPHSTRLVWAEVPQTELDEALLGVCKRNGAHALVHAISSRYADMVRALLAHGANANTADTTGWTPLRYVKHMRNTDILQMLLAAGCNPNAVFNNGFNALMFASCNRRTDVVMMLLAAGADVNAEDTHGRTALWLANDDETRQVLIEAGARA
jgi:hypothetical protein